MYNTLTIFTITARTTHFTNNQTKVKSEKKKDNEQ